MGERENSEKWGKRAAKTYLTAKMWRERLRVSKREGMEGKKSYDDDRKRFGDG